MEVGAIPKRVAGCEPTQSGRVRPPGNAIQSLITSARFASAADSHVSGPPPVRVAVADDHELFRTGLRELLTQHGFSVVGEVDSGEAALELAAKTALDVFVMDVNMPGMGGIEAARRLTAASPPCRVLMLSVSPEDRDVNEAILAGACGYMLKDASPAEIVAAVAAAARGESLLSPHVTGRLLEQMRGDAEFATEVRPELTERELEVLRLVAQGKENIEIAEELSISVQTVKSHVSNLLTKLDVDNRIQAAVFAIRRRIV